MTPNPSIIFSNIFRRIIEIRLVDGYVLINFLDVILALFILINSLLIIIGIISGLM